MNLREAVKKYKQFKIPSLSVICEKAGKYSKTCILIAIILFLVFIYLIQQIPHWQVATFDINNSTEIAQLENSYRATLAQILGGIAVAIGIYFAWGNLTTAREGQITERFTKAVDQLGAIDQLGNPAIEIRLGGIYALERIANESDKDYWPIIEILTAYVRKNSCVEIVGGNKIVRDISTEIQANEDTKSEVSEVREISLDIQAILTVIGKRKYSCYTGEIKPLDLHGTRLCKADFSETHFEKANFMKANLQDAYFQWANLEGAYLEKTNLRKANLFKVNLHKANLKWADLCNATLVMAVLTNANLQEANLQGAFLSMGNFESADFGVDENNSPFESISWYEAASLEDAHLEGASFKKANLKKANLKGAFLIETKLEGANLKGADLRGAVGLTVDQLSKVETLYRAKLDDELLIQLREKYSHLFDMPENEPEDESEDESEDEP